MFVPLFVNAQYYVPHSKHTCLYVNEEFVNCFTRYETYSIHVLLSRKSVTWYDGEQYNTLKIHNIVYQDTGFYAHLKHDGSVALSFDNNLRQFIFVFGDLIFVSFYY